METGTVKWFNEAKGFGFILREGQPDLFVHYSQIKNRPHSLKQGETVKFEPTETERGVQATNVRHVGKGAE